MLRGRDWRVELEFEDRSTASVHAAVLAPHAQQLRFRGCPSVGRCGLPCASCTFVTPACRHKLPSRRLRTECLWPPFLPLNGSALLAALCGASLGLQPRAGVPPVPTGRPPCRRCRCRSRCRTPPPTLPPGLPPASTPSLSPLPIAPDPRLPLKCPAPPPLPPAPPCSAQPYRAPPRPISLLVVDFDDTCTASDSSGLVMQTAIEATVAQVRRGCLCCECGGVVWRGVAWRGVAWRGVAWWCVVVCGGGVAVVVVLCWRVLCLCLCLCCCWCRYWCRCCDGGVSRRRASMCGMAADLGGWGGWVEHRASMAAEGPQFDHSKNYRALFGGGLLQVEEGRFLQYMQDPSPSAAGSCCWRPGRLVWRLAWRGWVGGQVGRHAVHRLAHRRPRYPHFAGVPLGIWPCLWQRSWADATAPCRAGACHSRCSTWRRLGGCQGGPARGRRRRCGSGSMSPAASTIVEGRALPLLPLPQWQQPWRPPGRLPVSCGCGLRVPSPACPPRAGGRMLGSAAGARVASTSRARSWREGQAWRPQPLCFATLPALHATLVEVAPPCRCPQSCHLLPTRPPVPPPASPPPSPRPLQADGSEAQGALRAELQRRLQWLVGNYASRRQSLLEEILPEVRCGAAVAVPAGSAVAPAAASAVPSSVCRDRACKPGSAPLPALCGEPSCFGTCRALCACLCPAWRCLQPEEEPQDYDFAWLGAPAWQPGSRRCCSLVHRVCVLP